MSENKLRGQVALVTGASRGIGRATAIRLAADGAKVAVNYARNREAADAAVQEILRAGGEAKAIGFDVSQEAEVEKGIDEVVSHFGGLDILVNNAGMAIDGLILRTKTEDWQQTLDVNLSSVFFCSRKAAKLMLKAKRGRIINVSSVIGEMGNAGQVAYAASKSGIFGLTKSLAQELGSRGITVNAITPGFISTDMTKKLGEEHGQELLKQIPLGRLGTAEEVAALVAFLASPDAGYVTGEVIAINGGLHM